MMTPIPTLETARLVLRPFCPADADAVTELINDAAVSATLETIPYPYYREYADWWINTHESLFAERRELHLAVVLRAQGGLLGAVSLLSKDPDGPPQLGYWLGRRHWGRGYATEAVGAIIRYAQRELGARTIAARCMVDNPASVAVLTKVGLRRVGRCTQLVTKGGRTCEVDEFLLQVTSEQRAV
jgi:RimJ/RimL family protein N-acetyltransferase